MMAVRGSGVAEPFGVRGGAAGKGDVEQIEGGNDGERTKEEGRVERAGESQGTAVAVGR